MRKPTIEEVKSFWEQTPNGEIFVGQEAAGSAEYFGTMTRERYRWAYHVPPFLDEIALGKPRVLEIGSGLGVDASELVKRGCEVVGVDLTERAVGLARKNFERLGLKGTFQTGNAEALDFPDASFDRVYSLGVLHHTPDTAKAIEEVRRVLKPGGKAFIMLYSRFSLNRFAHLILRLPYEKSRVTNEDAPVTRVYSKRELRELFGSFEKSTFRKRYLFGAGWRPISTIVPQFLNDWLGRIAGWHWMIVAEKSKE